MARPPRRSRDGGRRRRRQLHILTGYDRDGEGGLSIYKLNEEDFDSDDAYSEGSEGSSSIGNDSGSYSDSDDACSDDSRYSGSISSDDSADSGSSDSENERGYPEAQERFDSEYDVDSRARRLRRRRLVGRLGFDSEYFVAAGTKIFGLNSSHYRATTVNFAFDASTRMVSVTPPFQTPKKSTAIWAIGGEVYALGRRVEAESQDQERRLFERLRAPQLHRGDDWAWEALPPPPFKRDRYLESHAVHPDGATVFMSFHKAGTFSFNGERTEWTRHGDWELPFDGEAFYARDLDAWVGLCSVHRGRLAACRVVDDPRGGGAEKPRECKCGRELLFRHKWRRHSRANLVHMGNASFCLLETITGEDEDRRDTAGMILPMLLRAVTFRVRYSFDGELCVVDRRSKVYKLPWHSSEAKPLGFWI